MSRNVYENQAMLVVVGLSGTSIIAATNSPAIQYEVKEVSPMLEDHFPDNAPTEPGLHVWEGTLTVETGGWVGSEMTDGDAWWDGAFRPATMADVQLFSMLPQKASMAPSAIPTADVPVLHLKCYHLCVQNMGVSWADSVKNHSGHNHFELVDPEEGASAALQAWANEETADGRRTLRHLVIEDRFGARHVVAQRRGQVSSYSKQKISFDAYTDYAGVLANPGVTEMMAELEASMA